MQFNCISIRRKIVNCFHPFLKSLPEKTIGSETEYDAHLNYFFFVWYW